MWLGTQVLHEPRQAAIQSLVSKYRCHHSLLSCRLVHRFQFTPSSHLWVMLSLTTRNIQSG